eukprot:m.562419 g.562419  ORF g.562419 m.562419 type:complete len:107 (+) comp22222_c0_seq5:961-1281(+)
MSPEIRRFIPTVCSHNRIAYDVLSFGHTAMRRSVRLNERGCGTATVTGAKYEGHVRLMSEHKVCPIRRVHDMVSSSALVFYILANVLVSSCEVLGWPGVILPVWLT